MGGRPPKDPTPEGALERAADDILRTERHKDMPLAPRQEFYLDQQLDLRTERETPSGLL